MTEITQIDAPVLSIAISSEQTYFAASLSGLYRSDDRGQTWQRIDQSDEPLTIMAVAASPDYLNDRAVFAGLSGGVMRSSDGGATWAASVFPPPTPTVSTLVLSPAYAKDGTLFAGTDADGVFRSSDRGITWESWNFGLLDRSVLSMAVSPAYAQDEVLFIGTPSGLFRSRNGGRAWREVEFPGESAAILCLAISPDFANDGLLYVGTEANGLFALKGQEWSPIGAGVLEGSVNVVVLSAGVSAQDILVATELGLYISHDQGATWASLAASTGIMALAAPHDRAGKTPILAGLADGGVQLIAP